MALSNGISGELLSPVPTSGELNPGEMTVNHTGGRGSLLNVQGYISCIECTEKLHYGGLGMSENRSYNFQ